MFKKQLKVFYLFTNKYFFSSFRSDIFTVSLIGKPNVGKSSLFNKLAAGSMSSIIDPMPGLTRDRVETISYIMNYPIRLIDTAGIEKQAIQKENEKQLYEKMINQTNQAIILTDLCLFLVDAREGITISDINLSKHLQTIMKQQNKDINKIILIANKCDKETDKYDVMESIHKLGLGDPIYVSSNQGIGIVDILQKIEQNFPENYKSYFEALKQKRIQKHEQLKEQTREDIKLLQQRGQIPTDFDVNSWEDEFDKANPDPGNNSDLDSDQNLDTQKNFATGLEGSFYETYYSKTPIQLAIVGRPNCGKSSLVNSLLKEERVIMHDLPGTTRDSIAVQWAYKGKKIILVDTAGIEKNYKKQTPVEQKFYKSTLNTVKYSHVVMFMIDALGSFNLQEIATAQELAEEGRAMIIVINKWDLVPQDYKRKITTFVERQLKNKLGDMKGIKIYCISAKTGQGVDTLMDSVLAIYDKWNFRVATGTLNSWLRNFKKISNLPTEQGDILKIKFISQIKTRPPTFVVFINDKALLKHNYYKFLRTKLSHQFDLQGIPIRLIIRDAIYKVNKKQHETDTGQKLKEFYLNKRKIASPLKIKLSQQDKDKLKEGKEDLKNSSDIPDTPNQSSEKPGNNKNNTFEQI